MSKARFTTELVEGHKGVTVVLVPLDPTLVWDAKPVPLDDRRQGWLVTGTMNRARFDGWIGFRWGRYFIILDEDMRKRAKVAVGDTVSVVVEPTARKQALAKALEQAPLTTAPGKRKKARP
jgi:hypothetical protein